MKVYGYWHNRAVDGKQLCNHYAHSVGGDCGHPELGVWTPLVKLTPEMADRVQRAADRVVSELGSDADRAAIAALRQLGSE